MPDWEVDRLIAKHKSNGVLVDSNLLLLYFVGLCDMDWIRSFERTRQYSEDDFELLAVLIARFDRLLTLPNVVTEVSNLATKLGEYRLEEFRRVLQSGVGPMLERYLPSSDACSHEDHSEFGVTDTAVMMLAQSGWLVLTEDHHLYGCLVSRELDCLNFNQLRGWST